MKFNEKLQKLRKERGLSQEMLADMLDVSRQAISKWESGQSYPEMEKLMALSDIFGVTLDNFVKDGELHSNESGDDTNSYHSLYRRNAYEYISKATLFGLPLVHVHVGWGFKRAKGIVAIGNIANGFISIGLASAGLLSIGLASAGIIGVGAFAFGLLFAMGSIAIGTFAMGAIAVGIFTMGAVAVGMFSTGAVAVASHIAVGDYAYGNIAVATTEANGAWEFLGDKFTDISSAEVRAAILKEYPNIQGWIVRLMTVFLGR